MLAWEERPVEIANLLNPAFTTLLLRDAVQQYIKQSSNALPFPLAFLILPIVLYKPARIALPNRTTAILHAWLLDHPALKEKIIQLVKLILPYSREAIIFGLQNNALKISNSGGLETVMDKIPSIFSKSSEPSDCRRAAGFIGRWFGKNVDSSTILAIWGLRP